MTLELACLAMLVALAIVSNETAEVLRAIAAIIFFLMTAPISAHLLGKAAQSAGYRMGTESIRDERSQLQPREIDEVDTLSG